jgi:hypothetical protein
MRAIDMQARNSSVVSACGFLQRLGLNKLISRIGWQLRCKITPLVPLWAKQRPKELNIKTVKHGVYIIFCTQLVSPWVEYFSERTVLVTIGYDMQMTWNCAGFHDIASIWAEPGFRHRHEDMPALTSPIILWTYRSRVLDWLTTPAVGQVHFQTTMLFALGFLLFTIGG